MLGSSLPPVVCMGLIYVIYVWLRIAVSHVVLCFGFVFLRLVCPEFPVSLDCPF